MSTVKTLLLSISTSALLFSLSFLCSIPTTECHLFVQLHCDSFQYLQTRDQN